jgi:hypothetical protein
MNPLSSVFGRVVLFMLYILLILAIALSSTALISHADEAKNTMLNKMIKQELNWDGTPKGNINGITKKDRPLNKTGDFLIASGILLAATIYDVEATMGAGRRGAKEGNPWAQSFVEKGRAETYGYALAVDAVTLGIAYAIFKSKNPDTQKYWIVLPAVGIAGHAVGGTLNLIW